MPEGSLAARRRKTRGQSLVEFAISSTVLLLLAMGLVDLSRGFYYAINLQGAAREGARHGAWFNTAGRYNPYLDNNDIMTAVNESLAGAGITSSHITFVSGAGCLAPTDGNAWGDKPYPQSAFPSTPGNVNVYICYTTPSGTKYGSLTSNPTDNSWRLGDVNVAVLMNFQLITPFIQSIFGQGIDLAYNEHFTIQGKP